MNRASILPLAILFATTCATAQEKLSISSTYTPPQHLDRAQCPVGLDASHRSGLPLASFAEGEKQQGPRTNAPSGQTRLRYQQLHLTFNNPSKREIVSTQITVRGLRGKDRSMELSNSSSPDLAKTVEVAIDVKGNGSASKDLSLSQFTAITSIELNSITYADDSTWQASSPGACSVTPDLFMLVAATPER
jgi:hypothetical protein